MRLLYLVGFVAGTALKACTEAKNLRARVAELDAENDALADMVNDLARKLAKADQHKCEAKPSAAVARVELVNLYEFAAKLGLDVDPDAEGYEPAAQVYGPAVIEQHAAEFCREIDARLDDVIEGWAK